MDLGDAQYVVTHSATQGSAWADEWVLQYQLRRKETVNSTALQVENPTIDPGSWNFYGNTDRNTVVTHALQENMVARVFRLTTVYCSTWCAVRWEIYGTLVP